MRRLLAQLDAELDRDLIGRVIDRPEPGNQATGGWGDRGRGVLKSLVGLLHQRRVIPPALISLGGAADGHHRDRGGRCPGRTGTPASMKPMVRWAVAVELLARTCPQPGKICTRPSWPPAAVPRNNSWG